MVYHGIHPLGIFGNDKKLYIHKTFTYFPKTNWLKCLLSLSYCQQDLLDITRCVSPFTSIIPAKFANSSWPGASWYQWPSFKKIVCRLLDEYFLHSYLVLHWWLVLCTMQTAPGWACPAPFLRLSQLNCQNRLAGVPYLDCRGTSKAFM